MTVPDPIARPSVLLRHELPTGEAHIDWMIAPAGEGYTLDDRVLLTWRLEERVAAFLLKPAGDRIAFEGVRLADHRSRYLDYEGPVSGGRGSVTKVALGSAEVESESSQAIRLLVGFGPGWMIAGQRTGPAPDAGDDDCPARGLWVFTARRSDARCS